MKNTMKKKWIAILMVPILLVTVLLIGLNSSPEKKAVGNWELSGTFEDFALNPGNFGEYEYFNISLWESGGASISSYPTFTSALGTATEMATYYLTEVKNGQYDYLIKLFMANEVDELEYHTTRLLYNSNRDELMFFTSLDDGLLFKRTNELTTIEITTTEEPTQSQEEELLDYKSQCVDYVNSKYLVRYEQEYLGGKYFYVGQVQFINDDNTYVIITDENNDGLYRDNWIYVKDCRKTDKTKILPGDIVGIYATFTGTSPDYYPCFDLYYALIKTW